MSAANKEISHAWDRQGKTELISQIQKRIKYCNENNVALVEDDGSGDGISNLVRDVLQKGIDGSLTIENVVETITELAGLHNNMPAMITDVLSMLDVETINIPEEHKLFSTILKRCEKLLTDGLLKERIDFDSLQELGMTNNRYHTRFIKVKTKIYYKQKKFNLLREENEGYGKLITELEQEFDQNINPEFLLEVIKSLIGYFNLDPNRVLDIILESFEYRPQHDQYFVPLIRSYMTDRETLREVLGFKFKLYFPFNSEGESTPISLYTLTALMLKHGLVKLEDVYCWLSPEDSAIAADWEKELADAREYVRRLNIVSIKEKEKDDKSEDNESANNKYNENQKFGLAEALLRVGSWEQFQILNQRLPDYCLLSQPPISKALCNLLELLIEPLYRANLGPLQQIVSKPKNMAKLPSVAPKAVTTFLGLRETVIPMLLALGPSIHHHTVLMYKIIRISKAALQQIGGGSSIIHPPSGDSLYFDILTIFDEVLLPALSEIESNCAISEEIWNLLKFYPYQYRYCLYVRWKNDSHVKHATLTRNRGNTLKQIKAIMKRVSKENVKPVGRSIAKLSHSSPGVLFDYMLMQIQVFDNLIIPVVDSLKFLTNLSCDVLGCCLVESLSQGDKKRFKHDGTSISLWLQSLASFAGAVFKKYQIELGGILQYVANQLKAQKSLDLLILKEIVHKMAGVEAAEELTAEQIDAMSGGEILRSEAGNFTQAKNTKKSSSRLRDALIEQNLAVALCLLMAQQRYCVEYKETEKSHLKLVGKLYDQCQDTLVQFGTFLASSLTVEEYISRLPSVDIMLSKYHINEDVAFFLARPMYTHAINLKFEELRKADPNSRSLTTDQKHEKYTEACQIILDPIVESVRPLHPPKIWEDISPQFLVTFWSLTAYDLYVPVKTYDTEITKLKQLVSASMENKDGSSGKAKKEQEKSTIMMEKLQDERKKQTEHVEKVMARLKKEKDSWFLSRSAKSAKNETITQFLQLCLFPRCIFTAPDAVYCAKFVQTIHSLKAANFSTLLCYDRIFCDITYTVTSCTENEANRYGRFLCAMLDTVMRWHHTKEIFDAECANYPGFVTKFKVSNQFSDANDHVGFENYRHVCHKWHYKITKALVTCLDSKDYVQIRNSLIILMKILPHFPTLLKLYNIIERKVEKVREDEKEKRQDLYVLATSYFGQLKAKSSKLVQEKDFHQVNEKALAARSQVESISAKQDLTQTNKTVNGDSQDSAGDKKPIEIPKLTVKKEITGPSRDRPRETESRRDDDRSSRGKERRDDRSARSLSPVDKWDRILKDDRYEDRYYDSQKSRGSVNRDIDLSPKHHSQEPADSDRDAKRRKVDNASKREDGKSIDDKRSTKTKSRTSDDDKERKERKVGRKRDRLDDGLISSSSTSNSEQKRRKDDEKGSKSSNYQNGDPLDKHRYSKERSPYLRERSNDRDKHRRTNETKSRR